VINDPIELFPSSCLRLFLSADLVGSTAFKQASEMGDGEKVQKWLEPIGAFFAGIQRHLDYQWGVSQKIAGDEIADQNHELPRFWKAAGDEVIYVMEIDSPLQPLFAVTTFGEAISSYRRELQEISPNLGIKGTAWLAGFPVNNAEIVLGGKRQLPDGHPSLDDWWVQHLYKRYLYETSPLPNGKEVLDFIGPQMDLGFRLSAKSTQRRMMLSVDLAMMLMKTCERPQGDLAARFNVENRIFFDGTETLKGVLAGLPYPLIWLDAQQGNPLNRAEDEIRGREPPKSDKVISFCSEFIAQAGQQHSWVIEPFIMQGGAEVFGAEPDKHSQALSRMQQTWDNNKAVLDDVEPEDAEGDSDSLALDVALAAAKFLIGKTLKSDK